jgi:hypothetical protein
LKAEEAKSEKTAEAKPDEVKMPKPEYKKCTPKTQVPIEALLLQLSPRVREVCKATEAYFK